MSLKVYVSASRKDVNFYNPKTSLLSVRAALDHHLKSPPHNKKKFMCDNRVLD